jgi:lipopolysaccharide biosynthesis protein
LFVHFDRQGQVRPYVLRYVAILQESGFSVVFVTNSGRLQAASLAALQPLCAGILIRRNVGYDFGALRETLERLALPRENTDWVLFVNDSVYGPLRPLDPMLAQIDFEKADFWAATDSWQRRYHLQSYFLAAGRKVLMSDAWRKFWKNVRPVQSKKWVIKHYEVGLTQALIRRGFTCRAMWSYSDVLALVDASPMEDATSGEKVINDLSATARRNQTEYILRAAVARLALNPTADLWRQLLQSSFPFLKRELLRVNPAGVRDIADWRDELEENGCIEIKMIDADLKEVLRNRAP